MTIQYRSDITIVGVSELGFYLCEQHLLKPLFLSKIWKAQPMHFKHIFFFPAQTHALPLLQRQLHELGEVCTLQSKLGMSSSESFY